MSVKDTRETEVNEINKVLNQIIEEKNQLEKLTKKISQKSSIDSKGKTKKSITKLEVETPQLQQSLSQHNTYTSDNTKTNTELLEFKTQLNREDIIKQQLQIKGSDFKNVSKETINKILDLLKNYVNLDKSYRLKHETLKTLYNAYLDLYKKYKNTTTLNLKDKTPMHENNNSIPDESKHTDMLKNIHQEMKENNFNLYQERLMILKKIKQTPDIDHNMKNKICGKLIAIFKSPPIPEYKPLQLLKPILVNGNNTDQDSKISVNELDNAYLQKHNELLTVFQAYQNLYNKVLNYKEQLEKYKQLPTGSSISRSKMEKMIKDQRFVMDMIDKMQNNLVDNKIIDNSEKVLVTPVTSHPENMATFNNTMRDQIKHIINRNIDINTTTKNKIENLLSQYKECDSNDTFCNAGKKLILLKNI